MHERVNITAPSLPELLQQIGRTYFLDLDDVWIDEGNGVSRVSYNRLELANCDEPTNANWSNGSGAS